jgi:hypothetical protein
MSLVCVLNQETHTVEQLLIPNAEISCEMRNCLQEMMHRSSSLLPSLPLPQAEINEFLKTFNRDAFKLAPSPLVRPVTVTHIYNIYNITATTTVTADQECERDASLTRSTPSMPSMPSSGDETKEAQGVPSGSAPQQVPGWKNFEGADDTELDQVIAQELTRIDALPCWLTPYERCVRGCNSLIALVEAQVGGGQIRRRCKFSLALFNYIAAHRSIVLGERTGLRYIVRHKLREICRDYAEAAPGESPALWAPTMYRRLFDADMHHGCCP